MVLLLLIHCLLFLPLFAGTLCLVFVLLFATLCPSSFAISLMGERELVALFFNCLPDGLLFSVLWLFSTVPWVGMQCVLWVVLIILTYVYGPVYGILVLVTSMSSEGLDESAYSKTFVLKNRQNRNIND